MVELTKEYEASARLTALLNMRIVDCNFSVRATNCLKHAGIETVGQLVQKSKADLYKSRDIGAKTIAELTDFVESNGLTFGEVSQIPNSQISVTYYAVTKEQLELFAKEVAKNVLIEFGVDFDDAKARFTPDTKDEYKPLSYWLQKMNVNRSTLWRWQKEGRITPRYVGKKLFFRQRDFDEMFENKNRRTAYD